MMRALGAILLSLMFLIPLAMKSIAFGDYLMNKSFISQELCEQRQDENNTCQGKCYLKKQLSKVEGINASKEQVPTPSEKQTQVNTEIVTLLDKLSFDFSSFENKSNRIIIVHDISYDLELINTITPPPKNA